MTELGSVGLIQELNLGRTSWVAKQFEILASPIDDTFSTPEAFGRQLKRVALHN